MRTTSSTAAMPVTICLVRDMAATWRAIVAQRVGDSYVTVLVLDLDGVVVRGHPQGGRWDKDVARDFGMQPEHLQTRFFQKHWRRIEIGEADLFEVLEGVWPEL